jgi:asparagine synthase (glutamine-hydrolysing)
VCGIAGVVSLDPRRQVAAEPLQRMLSCLRHRGPDDEGTYTAQGVALGHRRLSIIDVAGGHQPLRGDRESTVAVVNGEIYNYRDLAAQLEARGSRFRSRSDSEVAAHAYDAWGIGCFERFDGMFAMAVWDGAERRLLLARDRMGEKPLFYTVADELLIFGSELSSLLAHPAVQARVDLRALREYLALEYVPAPHCLIEGVAKLEPGSVLILEAGRQQLHRYWNLDPRASTACTSYPDAVRELRSRLEEAVRSRLMSDVPLGVFLSGGLDSSAIAALAAREGPLETFTVGFEEASFDESSHARMVARHIGSTHHEQIVRGSAMAELVPRLGGMLDEPIGDASILPTFVLSRFARQHVTVALGGDGGDELFAGYPMHQGQRVARWLPPLPDTVLRGMTRAAAALPVAHDNFTLGFRLSSFLRGAGAAMPMNHALWMSSFSPAEQQHLLTADVLHATAGMDPFAAVHRRWQESAGAPALARATHLDAGTYLPDDILVKVDRASMAVGLEVRAPFLAHRVVEHAFAVPDTYRMSWLTGKRMLRDAVRDLLPAGILQRPKKGFGMPVGAWLNGALRDLADDLLGPDSVRRAGFFEPREVQRLLADHRGMKQDNRKKLWTLLVLELWRRENIEAPDRAHAAMEVL